MKTDSNSISIRSAFVIASIAVVIAIALNPASSLGQVNPNEAMRNDGQWRNGSQQQESDRESQPGNGIRLGPGIESVWEFGMEVTSQGQSKGIQAFVPIPMEWPEQEVEVIEEIKTDNVSRFTMKNNTKWTKQLEFKVARMNPNQVESGLVRMRIKKRMISAPTNTQIYSIDKKPHSSLSVFLKPSPYIESKDKRIIEIAESLRDESLGGWDQVEKNYRWVRDNIEYKFDKTIRSCLEALDKSQGDCEELSSLFIAICRAQKIPARAVWIPDHTYPEFYLVDDEGEGHWFPCQVAGIYEFGAMTEAKPILQKGDRFRAPVGREETRYLQPTLAASDATAPLAMRPIQREAIEGASENSSDLNSDKTQR